MGFFKKVFQKKKKKEDRSDSTKKSSGFSPVVVRTEDVPKTVHETAQRHDISAASLDIRLISLQTLIKTDEAESDWVEVESDDWEKFNKPEMLLTPNFGIKQLYEIEIVKYKEEPWESDLQLHIATNKEKNRIACTIKSGSIIRNSDDIDTKIAHLIQSKLLKSRMLIGLWDLDFMENIRELTAKAKVQGQYIVPKDVTFDVAVCYPSQPPIDDDIVYHYKKEAEAVSENGRIDHAKRGFIQAVEKGDVVIEYIKPKHGKPGRNCQGQYIPVEKPKETHRPEFKVTDAIEVIEDDDRILYRATRGGYVVFKENSYDIQDEMELEEVSFKKTGSIDAGVETEVKLHVNETDFMKDAIGTGVEVEATEVKVEGNVGASALVKAEDVVVGGMTHQSSRIYAKTARINVHRGFLKCLERAEISRLEGGIVEAKEAAISQVVGGEVKAMKIEAGILAANARLFGVTEITIDKMVGENNKIVIDPSEIDAYHDEITSLEKEIEAIEKNIEKIDTELELKNQIRQKSESAVATLKKRIVQDIKKGIKPKPAFVAKVKQFQKLVETIEGIEKKRREAEESLQASKARLLAYQEMILHAKIVNRGEWKEYTTIEFHLLYPQMKLEFTPTPGVKNQMVYLKKSGESEEGEPIYEVAVKEAEA